MYILTLTWSYSINNYLIILKAKHGKIKMNLNVQTLKVYFNCVFLYKQYTRLIAESWEIQGTKGFYVKQLCVCVCVWVKCS